MFLGMLSLLLGFVGDWAVGAAQRASPACSSASCSTWRTGSRRCRGRCASGEGVSLRLLLTVALAGEVAAVVVLARRAGEGLRALRRAIHGRRAALVGRRPPPSWRSSSSWPRRRRDRRARRRSRSSSVGEGAATLVQVPRGPTVLVDAGPAPLAASLRAHAVPAHRPARALARARRPHGGPQRRDRQRSPSRRLSCREAPQRLSGTDAPRRRAARGGHARALVRRQPTSRQRRRLERGRAARRRRRAARSGNQSENDAALVVVAALGGPATCSCPATARARRWRASACRAAPWSSCRITAAAAGSTTPSWTALAPRLAVDLRRAQHLRPPDA